MSYIDLRGHQVWSVEYKPLFKARSEKVVLLHGGLSATEDWDHAILPAIKKEFHVYGYDRTAHGRTKMREGFYHFDFQCDEAIAYLEDVVKGQAHLIGWSDGGIIALYLALKRPDLVKSIVAIGANYHYDCGAIHDVLSIEISDEDKAKFAKRSGQDPELLEVIVRKAYEVWATEPTLTLNDLGRITAPTLILAGDDEPFTSEHTFSMYEALPNARLAIIPGASHYVPKEKRAQTQAAIKDFYQELRSGVHYPMTRWPNRRKEETERLRGDS
jgi:pimeloyl-ACP methyl ester carboxylesterase